MVMVLEVEAITNHTIQKIQRFLLTYQHQKLLLVERFLPFIKLFQDYLSIVTKYATKAYFENTTGLTAQYHGLDLLE
jgi:hypothetical protein